MDLDLNVTGRETTVMRYTDCPPGGAVELWTMQGSRHLPKFYLGNVGSEFAERVTDWLLAHPKP
jgi:hypothetical protein